MNFNFVPKSKILDQFNRQYCNQVVIDIQNSWCELFASSEPAVRFC